ncbi:MAG: hypothetical protein ACREMH_10445 [Gemmatimonadales bacterium]
MTALSLLSLLDQHPGTPVTLLADEATARGVAAAGGPLARHVRLQAVPGHDGGDATATSRSIKTRLRELVEGDVLFLDADTLVLRPIEAALVRSRAVRLAYDRYRPRGGPALQLSGWVEDLLGKARWPRPAAYYNSGVIWLPDSAQARQLCGKWRRLWLEGRALGTWKDQPSLNVALHHSGTVEPLPPEHNVHPYSAPQHLRRSRILHFWVTTGINLQRPATLLEHLVAEFRAGGSFDRAAIERARRRNFPWVRPRGIRAALEARAWGEATQSVLRRLLRTILGDR